jgi:hypothetical protein
MMAWAFFKDRQDAYRSLTSLFSASWTDRRRDVWRAQTFFNGLGDLIMLSGKSHACFTNQGSFMRRSLGLAVAAGDKVTAYRYHP